MGRRRHSALIAVALVAAFAACKRSGPDWRVANLYAGGTSMDLLLHPAKVQAFRVDPLPRARKADEAHAGPFVASAAPVDVAADVAAELTKIFADAQTYDWQRGPKREAFRPQTGLLFIRGAYALEIALDLETAQIAVFAGDQPLGRQTFDGARERLVAIAKRVFPKDAAILALR